MRAIKYTYFATTIIALLYTNPGKSQPPCPKSLLFETYDFGDKQMELYWPLKFKVTSDSIFILNSMKNARPEDYTAFRILKNTCNWAKDLSSGQSDYKLELEEENAKKSAMFSILYKNGKGIIKLAYDIAEPMIFTVIKL